MPKVILYCRVSSEDQAQKDLSIPAQEKALRRYVHEQGPDWQIVAEYRDEGYSAFVPARKRPGFVAMMAFCKKNKVDTILVHKFCRFSRNKEDSVLSKAMLKRKGITVRSMTEPFDPDTKEGFLYESLIEMINQWNSMNLSSEVLKGMQENAERGYNNGGRAPYGYARTTITDKRGQEHQVYALGDDDEVAIVREIFDMAVEQGMGAKAIANALNGRGVRGPSGGEWGQGSVWHILSNPVYKGDLVWYKSKRLTHESRTRTDPDERIVVENAHPAIIPPELFARRAALAGQRSFQERTARVQRVSYLLSRIVRCAHCGSTFVGRRQKYKGKGGVEAQRYAYYCGGYMSKGSAVCRSYPLPKDWLEGAVLAALRTHLGDEEKRNLLRAEVEARIESLRAAHTTDARSVKAKLAAIDQQIDRYFKMIGQGWEIDRARALIEEAREKKTRLEEEVARVQESEYHQRLLAKNLETLERLSRVVVEDFAAMPFGIQRQALLAFVDEIVVDPNRELVMRFQVPFDNGGLKELVEKAEAAARGELDEDPENDSGESRLTRPSPDCLSGLEWYPQ